VKLYTQDILDVEDRISYTPPYKEEIPIKTEKEENGMQQFEHLFTL